MVDLPCGDLTYDQAIATTLEAHYRIDLCEACIGQSLWHCVTHLHAQTLFKLFSLGMGGLALVGLFTIIPILLWKALNERTNPR